MSRVLQGRGGGGGCVVGAADEDGSGGIEGDGVVTCSAVNKTLAWFRVGGGWRGQKRWRTYM